MSDVCTRNSHCEIFIVELQKNTRKRLLAAAAANLKSTAHASIDNEMNNYKLPVYTTPDYGITYT